MGFQANFWCYLWDLVDEGIDRALGTMQGELGVTGVSVATSYHGVEQLRPHRDVSPRTFRSEGGLQFQPDRGRYKSTRIKPHVATWLRSRNPLGELSEACERRGLALRGWTVCCHGSALAGRFPELAVKDVFGDPSPTGLCPVNPDVREYLRAVVEDLSNNYALSTIELEEANFPRRHSHAHEKVGFELGTTGELLRSLCFCESCRQAAARDGIDVVVVARQVQAALEQLYAGDERASSSVDRVLDEPLVARFREWRREQVTSLVASIRDACACRLVAIRFDHAQADAHWRAVAERCDGLLVPCYTDHVERLERAVRAAGDEAGGIERVEIGLSACGPPIAASSALVRIMARTAQLGVGSVNVYNYGLLPAARLDWVRQAIRYARREALAG